MIYLTAQPVNNYFLWQLELQIRNLRELGVSSKNIHVLFSSPSISIGETLLQFISENAVLCSIFLYEDTRTRKNYPSSIRPNIISQHFEKFNYLEQETIFYFDSDVIFYRKLDKNLDMDNICYVSDTRSYLSAKYVIKESSASLFSKMANIVGIDTKTILDSDENAGGAQYLLKGMNSALWKKIEIDSNGIYEVIKAYKETNENSLEPWCSDMWSLLWNLLLAEKRVKIHPELDFIWPDDEISLWGKKIILHYSGFKNGPVEIFDKTKYVHTPPWFDPRLSDISEKYSSSIVVDKIKLRELEIRKSQPKVENIQLIFTIEAIDEKTMDTYFKIRQYYNLHMNIKVLLKDKNNYFHMWSDIDRHSISLDKHQFLKTFIHWDGYFLIAPANYLFNPKGLLELSERNYDGELYVFQKNAYEVCPLLLNLFLERLDFDVLTENKGKFNQYPIDKNSVYLISSKYLIQQFNFNRIEGQKDFVIAEYKHDIYAL